MLTDSTVYKIKKGGEALGVFPFSRDIKFILIGFSGGADSSLLLSFFARLSEMEPDFPKIAALHVNHMMRGAESDRDEEFCIARAAELGIPLTVRRIDVPALMRESGLGAEECARNARYAALAEAARNLSSIKEITTTSDQTHISPGVLIATAHNADDNFETVLFNLTRGGGAGGLSGIPPVREDGVIRPLLCLGSDEIRNICLQSNIPYVTDSTNFDEGYTRNFIRKNVIPLLKQVNPAAAAAALRSGTALRADDEYLRSLALAQISPYLPKDGGTVPEIQIPRNILAPMPGPVLSRALVLLVSAVTPVAMGAGHIAEAMRLLSAPGTGKVSVPDGVTLEISKHAFSVIEKGAPPGKFHFAIDIPPDGECNRYQCPEAGFDLYISRNLPIIPDEFQNIYKLSIHTSVRFDTIYGKIYARTRLPGDTVVIGGHRRKVKKLLCDRGIRESLRNRIPVICDDCGIICIPDITPDASREKTAGSSSEFLHVLYCLYWRI